MTASRLQSLLDSGFIQVDELEMYYQVHGTGKPIVLLHGGMTTIESSFGDILPALAGSRQVIAVEQQAHGHTADIDRPLSFEQMADDTAAVLRALGVGNADFFGYSDGGNVALGIAIRHPELVGKLVVSGTNFNNEGLHPEFLELIRSATPDLMPDELRDAYISVTPRPGDWPVLVRKVMDQALSFRGWTHDELRSIDAPTLVVVGDSDIVRPEHAAELCRLVQNGSLAVLPNTDHGNRLDRPELLLFLIEEFLNESRSSGGID